MTSSLATRAAEPGRSSASSQNEVAVPGRQTLTGVQADYDPIGGGSSVQVLDMGSYQDRVAMLTMISQSHGSPPGMPNPADGIPIQTQWQQTSGRASMQWWSNVNFSLSVTQFLALKAQGEFPNVILTGTPPVQLSSRVYDLALDYWSYQAFVQQQWSSWEEGERIRQGEILQRKMWEFHTTAIVEALNDPSTQAAMAQMQNNPATADEARFADAWGNYMVHLLASVNFPLDQMPINFFNSTALPQSVLQPGDLDPATTRLTATELATVQAGIAFADFEQAHNRAITRLAGVIARFGGPGLTELRALIADAVAGGLAGMNRLWSSIVSLWRRLPFTSDADDEATAIIAEVGFPISA